MKKLTIMLLALVSCSRFAAFGMQRFAEIPPDMEIVSAMPSGVPVFTLFSCKLRKKIKKLYHPDIREHLQKGENPDELLLLILASDMSAQEKKNSIEILLGEGKGPDLSKINPFLKLAVLNGDHLLVNVLLLLMAVKVDKELIALAELLMQHYKGSEKESAYNRVIEELTRLRFFN